VTNRTIKVTDPRTGRKWSATFRPANYDEAKTFYATVDDDKHRAYRMLFDACLVGEGKDLQPGAKFTLATGIPKMSGDDAEAEVIEPEQLDDAAADAFVKKGEGRPKICVRLTDGERVETFLFLEPLPQRYEAYTKAKVKKGKIEPDFELVRQHCFHGDLERLKNEAPWGIMNLAMVIAQYGGLGLEAELGEA
jgi:hypothetical protein